MRPSSSCISLLALTVLFGCGQSDDSCDDLVGSITHSTVEITGIEVTDAYRRSPDNGVLEAVNQIDGVEFSNLVLTTRFLWVEEQHRYQSPNTFIQSLLDKLVAPAQACSLAVVRDSYEPVISDIKIYSDTDFSAEHTAGDDLSTLFKISGGIGDLSLGNSVAISPQMINERSLSLEALWVDGLLPVVPITPRTHRFTLMIVLEDGRAFETQVSEVLLSAT